MEYQNYLMFLLVDFLFGLKVLRTIIKGYFFGDRWAHIGKIEKFY